MVPAERAACAGRGLDRGGRLRQSGHMSEAELAECRAILGVGADVSVEELERAYLMRNFSLIRGTTDQPKPGVEAERQRLRAAYEALGAHLRAETERARGSAGRSPPKLPPAHAPRPPAGPLPPPRVLAPAPGADKPALLAFDNWKVNTFVPPLLLGLAWLINASPLGFLLKGFHVWMHELGHAAGAWMTGRKATPLPFGWTPVEDEFSWFVYGGLLFLFAVLFVAGWRERKAWPMVAAVGLAALQFHMTWRLTPAQQEYWWGAFGGVGGEFYLSTLFMMFFWVQMPEKFRWGLCRYVVFFLSASAFLNIYLFWLKVNRGLEGIPWGTLIHGEEDAGGDMNRLRDDYGWTFRDFRLNFLMLGNWCWVALGLMYAAFALRLNRGVDWIVARFSRGEPPEG